MRAAFTLLILLAAVTFVYAQSVLPVIWSGPAIPGNCAKILSAGPPIVLTDAGRSCTAACTNGSTDASNSCGVLTLVSIGVL